MKKDIGLLVFDLDGTLINSLDDLATSLNFTLRTMTLPEKTMDEVRYAIGDGVRVLLTRCMPENAHDRLDEAYDIFHDHYKDHCCDATYAYEGVKELLEKYADTPKAVLTNKNHQPTLDILKHLNLVHYFDVIVGGDSFPTRKPDPVGLLHIIETIGTTPEKTVMIGDGIPDIAVTKGTAVTSVAILDGITAEERLLEQNPDYTVKSFSELLGLLK